MHCRESDAILLYLVEKYDKEHKLSVADVNEKFKLIQWLFFQASGQGYVSCPFPLLSCFSLTAFWGCRPYFGQAVWFMKYHQEKLPSAIERYQKEILRVLGVLESVLSKQEWLVGGKLTVADISFITYVPLSCFVSRRLTTRIAGTRWRSGSGSRASRAATWRRSSLTSTSEWLWSVRQLHRDANGGGG